MATKTSEVLSQGNGNSNSLKRYSLIDYDYEPASRCRRQGGQDYEIQYSLKQIDTDGSYSYSNIVKVTCNLQPSAYELYQNYPNPFNPSTVISYQFSVK